ncbi:MAG: N-acetylmuramoyl-L-alanine amidase [Lachnospiraceae bacterium]|nr:N-acetylmuramoyl-L-alanine amidase [Lachnospiraceae bacterium]
MPKVILDAGHGGFDNGAVFQGRKEKDDNLNLALAVGEILGRSGVDVAYTRTTDVYNSPVEKARIANEEGGDVLVSLHRNSSPIPNTYSGVQTLLYDEGGMKQDMAEEINEELAEVGYPNLGISIRPNLAILRRTEMPALLVEAGFINSDADNRLFDEKFNETANAIAEGIMDTLEDWDGDDGYFPPGTYSVQTGLFRNRQNAVNMVNALKMQGFPASIVQSGEYQAVRVGDYPTLEYAGWAEQALRSMGYDTLLMKNQ